MLRQRIGERLARDDVEHQDLDIRSIDQKSDRDIAADVSRASDREKPQLRFPFRRRQAVKPFDFQGPVLQFRAGIGIAQELRDDRKIHDDRGIARLFEGRIDKILPDPAEIHALEGKLCQSRNAHPGSDFVRRPPDSQFCLSHFHLFTRLLRYRMPAASDATRSSAAPAL